MTESDVATSRWRPTQLELVCCLAAVAAAIVAAFTRASFGYVDGPIRRFSTPVWVLILIASLFAYLMRVRLRGRTSVDDASDDFFDRE